MTTADRVRLFIVGLCLGALVWYLLAATGSLVGA